MRLTIDGRRKESRMNQFGTISKLLTAALVLLVGASWAVPPDPPVLDEEPVFTPGLSNTVSWSDESASGATEYFVGASMDMEFPEPQQLDLSSGWISETSYTFDEVLEDGVLYYYRVQSRNADLEMSGWSEELVSSTQDASGPDPVTDLVAEGRYTYIRLNWSPVEDDGIGYAYFRVYRSETMGELGQRIDDGDETVTVGYFADDDVQPDVVYYYTVQPVDEFENETTEGNNQDDATLIILGDPDVEFVWPPTYYVTEQATIDADGVFYNTLAVHVNGRPARMTLDPAAGEFDITDIPLEMGLNLIIAVGTGTFERAESDTVYVFRLMEGSGDPVVDIVEPEDESTQDLGMLDITGTIENVGFLFIDGVWVQDVEFNEDFSAGTFLVPDYPVPDYGMYTIEAMGLGSPPPGELDDREAEDDATFYVIPETALSVAITSPPDQLITADTEVDVSGDFGGAWKVEVNDVMADLDETDDTFMAADIALDLGENTITAVATGADMATVEDMITVYRIPEDVTPTIEITDPADGFVTDLRSVTISGSVTNAGIVMVDYEGIDPVMAEIDFDAGTWSVPLDLPAPDADVLITATAYGVSETAEDQITVHVVESGAPTVEITWPQDGAAINRRVIVVLGQAERVGRVEVNGVLAGLDRPDFNASIEFLQEGWNDIVAVGYGSNGQTARDSIAVYVNTDCDGDPGEIVIVSPENGTRTDAETIDVTGTSQCVTGITVNGETAVFDILTGAWSFDDVALAMGANTITAEGLNFDGETVTASVMVYRLDQPSIAITSPEDEAQFAYEDSLITVTGTSTGLLGVTVNGVDASFDMGTGEWSVSGIHLDVGINTIAAVGDGLTEVTASITVERAPPETPEFHAIVTPNNDGYNDEVSFPVDGSGSTVTIFTRDGQEVIELTAAERFYNGWFIMWDGYDTEGELVKSGVYIYQIDNDGDKKTGTVVVAR